MVRQCVAHMAETFSTGQNQSTDKISSGQQYRIIHRLTLETLGHRKGGRTSGAKYTSRGTGAIRCMRAIIVVGRLIKPQ